MKPTGTAIRHAVAYWQVALGLTDWQYTVRIGKMPAGEWGEACVQVPYKRVEFRFSPSAMAKHGDTVDNCVVHEWGHCLVEPLAEFALKLTRNIAHRDTLTDLEERTVTDLTTLILRLHKR